MRRMAIAASLCLHLGAAAAFLIWPSSEREAPDHGIVVEVVSPPPVAEAVTPAMVITSTGAEHSNPTQRRPQAAMPRQKSPPAAQFALPGDAGSVKTVMADDPVSENMGSTDESRAAAPEAGATQPAGYRLGSTDTPLPDYPWTARRRGQEGRAVIRLTVNTNGHPTAVDLVESSGDSALDRAALDTLAKWRLRPALCGGLTVASQLDVPIRFELRQAVLIAGKGGAREERN